MQTPVPNNDQYESPFQHWSAKKSLPALLLCLIAKSFGCATRAMELPSNTGYDKPRASQSEDALDRWRFSSELMDVIRNTPIEWSVRVGLTGKWGRVRAQSCASSKLWPQET